MFEQDPNYSDHLDVVDHYKESIPEKYTAALLRKVLSISFYFNTARLSNNGQAYLLNYPEGTVVSIDPTSALGIQNLDSPWLVYTELGTGMSTRGIMRTISIIDKKWI